MKSRLPTFFFGFIVPLFLVVCCFGFYNRVEPRIFGLPFIYAWIFSCFAITSLCLLIAWRLDPLSEHNKKRTQDTQDAKR